MTKERYETASELSRRRAVEAYVRYIRNGKCILLWLTHGKLCDILGLPRTGSGAPHVHECWRNETGKDLPYCAELRLPGGKTVFRVYHVPVRISERFPDWKTIFKQNGFAPDGSPLERELSPAVEKRLAKRLT